MQDTRQITWTLNPRYEEDRRFKKWIWFTKCGRYRIDRWMDKYNRTEFYAVQVERIVAVSNLDKGGLRISDIPIRNRIWVGLDQRSSKVDKFPTLSKAITAIEVFSGMKSSNKDEVLDNADEDVVSINLQTRTSVEVSSDDYDNKTSEDLKTTVANHMPETKMSEMITIEGNKATIKESDARRLLVSMGHLTAEDTDKWDLERLERNFFIEKLAKLAQGPKGREPADPECLALLSDIVNHLKTEGNTVSITAEAKTKVKKTPKPSTNGGANNQQKDAWGYREGTGSAAINAVLMKSKKPLTVKEITEKANLPRDRVNHIRELMEKKFVEKVGDTYVAIQKEV